MKRSSECKVDRVVREYGLADADPRHDSIHEGLLARWRGEGDHAESGYRTLTEWFNRRLLRRAYVEHGRAVDGGRVEHDYDVLTGEDDLAREELVETLAAAGVDARQLRSDTVSWGTMRTHLQECLGGEKDRPTGGDWERDTVRMAESFAVEKVESALSSLATKGRLADFDGASVSVQVRLQCDRCPTRVPLEVALDRGYVCADHAPEEALAARAGEVRDT